MSISKRLREHAEEMADPFVQWEIYMADQLNKHIERMSAITATSTGGGGRDFEPVPSGSHIARCYQMIHIGTVTETILGEQKKLNKVRLVFELPYELKVFNAERGEQPYSIGKDYTLSMHEKSNLRRDLKGWRGKDFTEVEAQAFDITVLIGKACSLNVVHRPSKAGRIYAEIASISPVPRGATCPDAINTPLVFGYDPFDIAVFNQLPEWLRDKITSSEEFARVHAPSVHIAEETSDDLLF
jgi:hypothetical protein